MAPTLGKRKRQAEERPKITRESSTESDIINEEDAQAIFRRHFEAQFKPLPTITKAEKPPDQSVGDDEDDNNEESDWDGISDADDTEHVEVIEHTAAAPRPIMSKSELKAFMSSKPPALATDTVTSKTKSSKIPLEDDLSEAANLKKDLELQRLLTESHLLDSSTQTITGNNRHKATDLRLQKLGGKASIFKQEKMPRSHQQGIIAKSKDRESKRRREAKENGIILETTKEKKRVNKKGGNNGVNVSMPGVGKFTGGTLRLSKKDIMDIEGPKKGFRTGGGRGRGGRGGERR